MNTPTLLQRGSAFQRRKRLDLRGAVVGGGRFVDPAVFDIFFPVTQLQVLIGTGDYTVAPSQVVGAHTLTRVFPEGGIRK